MSSKIFSVSSVNVCFQTDLTVLGEMVGVIASLAVLVYNPAPRLVRWQILTIGAAPFVAIVATLAITACSAAPANDEEHDDPDIVLTEFAVSPDPIVVATDTRIVFTVRNDGGIFHELRFTNAERIADHLGEGDEVIGDSRRFIKRTTWSTCHQRHIVC